MENDKNSYQGEIFFNRITKNYRRLKKWARKNRITCYRLYDRDIPEIPLCLDIYTFLPDYIETKIDAAKYHQELCAAVSENGQRAREFAAEERNCTYARLYLYERPYEKPEEEEEKWLKEMSIQVSRALEIPESNIIVKTRKRQRGDSSGKRDQYEKSEDKNSIRGIIFEQGQLFSVDLTGYIDTGIFFDHRPLRLKVRETCRGKRVLNLFCYTGSFSVYAAEGGASFVESVDMSNTYTEWTRSNLKLNGFTDSGIYQTERIDAIHFLNEMPDSLPENKKFDIIILDPPTFSNSKSTDTTLDLNKDWPALIEKCTKIMSPRGILYFSTNSRRLRLNNSRLPASVQAREITESTIPEDFRNSKIHRAWEITFF
ncbi:class I SAM-dependent methyltransferase [Treponema sp.]|uniref:class I SAM-dependent methyltransferase n=1 Tax=Treponema sp. TaxID=166 RepID=UPI003F0B7E2A